MSCPQGFEPGLLFSCHMQCPPDFKYTLSGSDPATGGQCVYIADNSVTIGLTSLPMLEGTGPETQQYRSERDKFARDLAAARNKISELEKTKTQINQLNAKRGEQASEYTRIQGEYAGYTSAAGTTKIIKEVSDSLRPFRPPTAPADDIERERKAIAATTKTNLLVIQIALFVVVLVLLTYVIVPGNAAHMIAFLLIVVGIASAFFLKK